MILRNRIVSVLGLLALLAVSAHAFVFKHDTYRRELSAENKSMVIMLNNFGSVEVISSKEERIIVEAEIYYSDPVQAGINAMLGGNPMKIRDRKDHWEIMSEFDPDIGQVDCKLTVPETMSLEIQSKGKVVCNNHKGSYKITSATSAQVTVGNCEVAATVDETSTTPHDIGVERIRGYVGKLNRLLDLPNYLNDLK
ncbi:MAG: hypothetical protein OEM52_12685 [bacterium]|nr:hypothetical protein [bacterium]